MKTSTLGVALLFLCSIAQIMRLESVVSHDTHKKPRIGQKAPPFTAPDEEGKQHSLEEFKGSKVALFFYPKANTYGCNAQACGFRDMAGPYKKNNVIVIGMSYDAPADLKAFKDAHNLPFILLSDGTKEIAKKYGVFQEHYPFVPARVTFLIDEKGDIVKVLDNITVTRHAQDVLDAFGIPLEQQAP